jgi:hypothetical protein
MVTEPKTRGLHGVRHGHVAGAEDDPRLCPASRSQNAQALRAALQEYGPGAFEHRHTNDGTIWRVPNFATTRVALERALASVSYLAHDHAG